MKMIKLTNVDNTTFLLNISNIDAIYEDRYEETTICTTCGEYCCKESAEEIYQKIKEIEND